MHKERRKRSMSNIHTRALLGFYVRIPGGKSVEACSNNCVDQKSLDYFLPTKQLITRC